MKRNILFGPDATPASGGPSKTPPIPPAPSKTAPPALPAQAAAAPPAKATPLAAETALQKIVELQTALKAADGLAQLLLLDPHFRNCPFVAAIRGPVTAGIERIEHLTDWLATNPVPTP